MFSFANQHACVSHLSPQPVLEVLWLLPCPGEHASLVRVATASGRQELAFACTQSAGVFSALALALNLLRCRNRPNHVGEVSRESWAVPLVADRLGKTFVVRRGWLRMNLVVLLLGTMTMGSQTIPRNVVNLKRTMDAPSGDYMRTFVGSACDGLLLERRRRNWMTSRGPCFSIFWSGERLDMAALELLSRVMGVASRSRSAALSCASANRSRLFPEVLMIARLLVAGSLHVIGQSSGK